MKKTLYIIVLALLYLPYSIAQGVVNMGSKIIVSQGNYMKITGNKGHFINSKTGAKDGKVQNDGRISVQGNWKNSAAADNVFINRNGIGEVVFNGTVAQEIDGTTSTFFENLKIDNANGVVLSIDQTVDNKLILLNGKVSTASNKIIILDTTSNAVQLFSASNYINGNLRRYVKGGIQYAFPVGTAANYELAEVDVTTLGQLKYLDASFVNASAGAVPLGLNVDGTLINDFLDYGYWSIKPDNDLNAVYDISATSRGHSNGAAIPSAHALFYRSNTGVWENFGVHNNATQTGTGLNPITARRTNANSFYEYAIGKSTDDALDVDLLGFDASCERDNTIKIFWSTASESNNNFFTVYKGLDVHNWVELGRVQGAGNSNQINNYSITDSEYHGGIAYYRLIQTDYDGSTAFFLITSVDCFQTTAHATSIYPNPATDILNIKSDMTENVFDVKIYNLEGMLCYSSAMTGSGSMDISSLTPALYYVITTDRVSGEQYKEKIVIN